jgi:hypothetical protein
MQFAGILADEHAQRITLHFQLVVGGNLLRCRQVEARLRFVGIGDRRRADLEVLLRLLASCCAIAVLLACTARRFSIAKRTSK